MVCTAPPTLAPSKWRIRLIRYNVGVGYAGSALHPGRSSPELLATLDRTRAETSSVPTFFNVFSRAMRLRAHAALFKTF
jgi:hypothetical protein